MIRSVHEYFARVKPGNVLGYRVNWQHPLAQNLTRVHLYNRGPINYDLVHGYNRFLGNEVGAIGRKDSGGLVGVALDIPDQVNDAIHVWHSPSRPPQPGTMLHHDWDPEYMSTPMHPFTAAVLFETTYNGGASRWPCVLMCENNLGTRAGFELGLANQFDMSSSIVVWSDNGSNSHTYSLGAPTINDGKPHLLCGGLTASKFAWSQLDDGKRFQSGTAITGGNLNMGGKNMSHGRFTDAAPDFERLTLTRVGGWLFWKCELPEIAVKRLYRELYGGLLIQEFFRPMRTTPVFDFTGLGDIIWNPTTSSASGGGFDLFDYIGITDLFWDPSLEESDFDSTPSPEVIDDIPEPIDFVRMTQPIRYFLKTGEFLPCYEDTVIWAIGP